MTDPTPTFYGTAADVIDESGVNPEDLGLVDDPAPEGEGDPGLTAAEKLALKIEGWLTESTDLINRDRNRDYRTGDIPPGIHRIARNLVCNLINHIIFLRSSKIVQVGEFAIRMPDDTIFTKAIKDELGRYPALPRFSFMRVRRADEIEEEEEEA